MSEFDNGLKLVGEVFSALVALIIAFILFGTLGSLIPQSGMNMAPFLGLGFLVIVGAVVIKIYNEVTK
jgi:hypothetical protein